MDALLHKRPATALNKLILCRGKYTNFYKNYVYANQTAAYIYAKGESGNLLKGFYLKVPRIPKMVKEEIIRFFRSEMPNEAICKILFNHRTGVFTILKPTEMRADRVSVDSVFHYPTDRDTEIVATFHSHNTMPAFFSATDDAAELLSIGVFGVIGQLDKDNPQIVIRAVYEGGTRPIMPIDFFDAT